MVTPLPHYDLDDLAIARVRMELCQGCGHLVDAAVLVLETTLDEETGDLLGIQVATYAICCGYRDGCNIPPTLYAKVLNHLEECPHHEPH